MIDMEKAEDRDVQVLKDLVMEFHDELSVLGVGVEGLDTRVGRSRGEYGWLEDVGAVPDGRQVRGRGRQLR